MEYRILGKTGLKISRLGLGGIPIQKIDAEMTLLGSRLNNENFVSRAPAQLVAKEKERYAFLKESKTILEQKLQEL